MGTYKEPVKTVDIDSWTEFAQAVDDIRKNITNPNLASEILFRGQSNSQYPLKTTLERTTSNPYTVSSYIQKADSAINEIESLTGKQWNLPSFKQIRSDIEKTQDVIRPNIPEYCYSYLVYLRHHGFPSPLLDWTRSPYIAAFFAFESQNNSDRCAVYSFIEAPNGMKAKADNRPNITSIGKYITTHIRHYSQKASYTIATEWDEKENLHRFCPHESIVPQPFIPQDLLFKITIPRSERVKALKQLDDEYNINAYTLFQSEDSLVKTLGLRAFELE